jgi:hypothetical protein
MADIIQQFPSANGVSPNERGTSTQPFVFAQAPATGPLPIPWSKYIPFAKGADLVVAGTVTLIPFFPIAFSGTAKIEELTNTQLDFAVIIPPIKLPNIFDLDPDKLTITARITYVEEGGRNTAVFSIAGGREQQKNVNIQSKPDERILIPPGGLELKTGFKAPIPEKVELKELHFRPAKDQVELKVVMASPIPDVTITVSKTA